MSLCPFFDFERPVVVRRPSQLFNQHFGLTLDPEDLIQPLTLSRMLNGTPAGYMRPWRSAASQRDVGSTLHFDKNKFQVSLDVQQFKPEEVSVKLSGDNVITVEAKHEEKEDQHGYISRHFVRRYVLPKECDLSKVESKLSSDGILSITAPKVNMDQLEQREISITQTGEPAKKIQNEKPNTEST